MTVQTPAATGYTCKWCDRKLLQQGWYFYCPSCDSPTGENLPSVDHYDGV